MQYLGTLLCPWIFGLMASVIWIKAGYEWKWVAAAWGTCFVLNWIHRMALIRKINKARESRMKGDITNAKLGKKPV